MEILYIISLLVLFISMILVKKSEKEQNILFWIIITAVITLCYNVFESYIITIVKLKSTLPILAAVNLFISVFIILVSCKTKKIQKYYIKWKDIIALLILLVLVGIIGYKQYGPSLQIKYETTDPAVHYNFADKYYESQQTPAKDNKTTMPGAYTNTGILFTIFSGFMEEIELYKIYIMFDIVILFLIVAVFYIGTVNKENSIKKSIVALVVSIIFVCGYPLNSMIFGYSYLSVGILILVATISMISYIKSKELNMGTLLLYMFLLTYGIFFTYYFFVPVMYSSIGIYMLIDMLKNRKSKNILSIFTKENIINVLVILILPTILGICYFILPTFISSEISYGSAIAMEGYCYRDLYSNFIFFIPFALYYCISKLKNKENSFLNTNFIITIVFTLALLYMGLHGKASSYYYYKIYFLISILIMQILVEVMYELIDKKIGIYVFAFLTVYLGILGYSIKDVDTIIATKNYLFNPVARMSSYTDIYSFNYTKLKSKVSILDQNQIDAIKLLKEKDASKENTQIYGGILQMLWINNIAKLTESNSILELQRPVELNIEDWIANDNKQYYLCLDANEQINKNSDKYKIIYEKENAIILEKTNI